MLGLDKRGLKEVAEKGDQFIRYWKSVDEDIRKLAEAMNANSASFQKIFNDNMILVAKELSEIKALMAGAQDGQEKDDANSRK